MTPDHHFDDYRNRRILVMGLGSFGGGIGAVKFLVARGAHVTVTDLRTPEKLIDSLAELKDTPPARLVLGGHHITDFQTADLIVVNPAVKRDCPYLNAAIHTGVPITSEMNLFWKWNRAPIIGVTGSNGKSTTTAMIHSIVSHTLQKQKNRRAWLGGNIGASLLPQVEQIQPHDIVVLELSSFQLADLDRLQVSPHIAVVTNFTPNHLDWHPSLDHYRWSKQTILRWQSADDFAVLNDDDLEVCNWPTKGHRRGFGLRTNRSVGAFKEKNTAVIRSNQQELRLPLRDWLHLPGEHNFANALAAIAASTAIHSTADSIQSALESYQPLPHRLQFVGEYQGRRFFNDSLATTPESTEVALNAFHEPIVLLAGGYDKHVDLSGMARAISARAKAVVLMGQTASTLQKLIQDQNVSDCRISEPQTSFVESFEWAVYNSAPGDVILLSPGCASYDWFKNFSDRGAQFTQLVKQLMQIPHPMDNETVRQPD